MFNWKPSRSRFFVVLSALSLTSISIATQFANHSRQSNSKPGCILASASKLIKGPVCEAIEHNTLMELQARIMYIAITSESGEVKPDQAYAEINEEIPLAKLNKPVSGDGGMYTDFYVFRKQASPDRVIYNAEPLSERVHGINVFYFPQAGESPALAGYCQSENLGFIADSPKRVGSVVECPNGLGSFGEVKLSGSEV